MFPPHSPTPSHFQFTPCPKTHLVGYALYYGNNKPLYIIINANNCFLMLLFLEIKLLIIYILVIFSQINSKQN